MKFVTYEAFKKALENALDHQRNYLIMKTLYLTGLRVGELVSLTPNNVIWTDNSLYIKGKGNKIRNIDIPPDLTHKKKKRKKKKSEVLLRLNYYA